LSCPHISKLIRTASGPNHQPA